VDHRYNHWATGAPIRKVVTHHPDYVHQHDPNMETDHYWACFRDRPPTS